MDPQLRYQLFKVVIGDLSASRLTSNRTFEMLSVHVGADVAARIAAARLIYRIVSTIGPSLVNEAYAGIALDNLRELLDRLVKEEEASSAP
jgi:hypothetical protein